MKHKKALLLIFSVIIVVGSILLINTFNFNENIIVKEKDQAIMKHVETQFSEIGFKEIGPVPVSVIWENREYSITYERVSKTDGKLGLALEEGTNNQREIYSISNRDSKLFVAISTLNSNIFLVAKVK